MITPAVSVLSAVEGLSVAAPAFTKLVLPISVVILVLLFSIQRTGTSRAGAFFGPIMLFYFLTIATLGTLSLVQIVEAQRNSGYWYFFLQPLGFILFFICGVAENNRAPFDLPEAESELVAGFHTEYSGFRFSLFFLAEYAAMIVISSMAVTLFWGGWLAPFPNWLPFLNVVPGVIWFALKVLIFLYMYLWFRASWPRYRYDQLMKVGWQYLMPIAIGNLIVTAVLVYLLSSR